MTLLNKFEVFQFTGELIDDFIELFNQSFISGSKIDHKRVLRIYGEEKNYLGFLAYDNKKPIAFYGLIKLKFVFGNEIINIAQSVNSMVLPKYRKYNLFYHLAILTQELAQKENIKLIFGLPNTPELFHSILEWSYLGPMKKYSFKVATIPVAKIFWKLYHIRPIYILIVNLILKNFTSSSDSIEDHKSRDLYIPRSKEYMNYKKKLGAKLLTLLSTNLLVSLDYRLKIGEISDTPLENLDKIIKNLKRICLWLGIDEICFSVDCTSEWNKILKDKYLAKDDLQLMYYPLDDKYKVDFIHITMADFDTF